MKYKIYYISDGSRLHYIVDNAKNVLDALGQALIAFAKFQISLDNIFGIEQL